MAVPAARTWADNDPLNTTNLNTGVRDGITWMLSSRPVAQLHQISAQSVPNATNTAVTFTSEDFDSHNGHDNTTNPSRYVFQEPGKYLVSGAIGWAANATGRRASQLGRNGTIIDGSVIGLFASGNQVIAVPVRTMLLSVAAGDYVELFAFQDSGAALNTDVSNHRSTLTVLWVMA